MVLVLHTFFLQLLVEGSGAFFKSIVVVPPAVEIDLKLADFFLILRRQHKRAVGLPMRNFDGISVNHCQQFSERRSGANRLIKLLRRFGHQRSALRTDC